MDFADRIVGFPPDPGLVTNDCRVRKDSTVQEKVAIVVVGGFESKLQA